MSKKISAKKRKEGRAAAVYFGTECQANPGSGFSDYRNDIADYYGFKSWDKMPQEIKTEATEAFKEGRAKEKKYQ